MFLPSHVVGLVGGGGGVGMAAGSNERKFVQSSEEKSLGLIVKARNHGRKCYFPVKPCRGGGPPQGGIHHGDPLASGGGGGMFLPSQRGSRSVLIEALEGRHICFELGVRHLNLSRIPPNPLYCWSRH